MTELRHVMGLLTMADEGEERGGGPDLDGPAAELSPQPGLDQLEMLVGRVRATGLHVDLTVTGPPQRADVDRRRVPQRRPVRPKGQPEHTSAPRSRRSGRSLCGRRLRARARGGWCVVVQQLGSGFVSLEIAVSFIQPYSPLSATVNSQRVGCGPPTQFWPSILQKNQLGLEFM